MPYATLGQAAHLLDLASSLEKGALQELFNSGFISDLFSADITRLPDRNVFRALLGLLPVEMSDEVARRSGIDPELQMKLRAIIEKTVKHGNDIALYTHGEASERWIRAWAQYFATKYQCHSWHIRYICNRNFSIGQVAV